MKRMADGKAAAFSQNIIIKDGQGKYPKCFETLPYGFCPKPEDVPSEPKKYPKTCKFCQEFLKSKFYQKHFMMDAHKRRLERLKAMGMPTIIVNERR